MGKKTNVNSLDAALNYTKNNANQVLVCVGEPADRTAALAAALAAGAIDSTDFTLANGDVSGRKYTFAAQTGLSITSSGSGDHVVIISATELLDVTTCAAQNLTSGGTVDLAAFDREIAQAA